MTFGGPELFIVLGVIVLFFGARKIPELARGIGQGIREFRKVSDDSDDYSETAATEDPEQIS